jgi:hypothetical protein
MVVRERTGVVNKRIGGVEAERQRIELSQAAGEEKPRHRN